MSDSPPEGLSCDSCVSGLRFWEVIELRVQGVLLSHVVYGPPLGGDGPVWVLIRKRSRKDSANFERANISSTPGSVGSIIRAAP